MTACANCGEEHEGVTGFVLKDGDAFAVYYADWYPHANEAYVEVVLGSFEDPEYADNVTLGCRYGYVDGVQSAVASLMTPTHGGRPIFGQVLNRDDALQSNRLHDFWNVTDWLVLNDPLLHRTVFHLPPNPNA